MIQLYTLDTNCIIDLEENRPDAIHVRKMIADHDSGIINLAVVAISASERQLGGKPVWDYSTFENKLKNVGINHLEQLIPMKYWDVTFWGHDMWDGDSVLEKKIHDILFPGEPIEKPQEFGFSDREWKNHKCDVQIAWAHVYHNRDVLVTSDDNYHKKSVELAKIGLNKIIKPSDYAP